MIYFPKKPVKPSQVQFCIRHLNKYYQIHSSNYFINYIRLPNCSGTSSIVGIAIGCGLDVPGIESQCQRGFLNSSRLALWPNHPPVQWIPPFFGVKYWLGRDADLSPPSSALVKKEYSYNSTPSMGRTACTEPQSLYKGAIYLTLTNCAYCQNRWI